MAHHVEGHVLVQLLLLFLELLFHLADLADGLIHFGVELGGLLAQRLPVLVVQGLEFIFAQGLAFLAGEDHQAGGGNVEDKAFFPRLGVQFLEDLVAFLGEAVHEGFPAVGVVFALEHLGDLHLQVGDELFHIRLQEPAFAGGQAQALGLLRVLEIVDIDIIRRRGLSGGQLLHVGHDGFGLPGPGRPGHEDVVFQVLHPQAEFQGVDGPVLGHDLFLQGADVQGGFESQSVGVTDGAQALGLQFPAVWRHGSSSSKSLPAGGPPGVSSGRIMGCRRPGGVRDRPGDHENPGPRSGWCCAPDRTGGAAVLPVPR